MSRRFWVFPIFLCSLLVACSGGDSDKSNVHKREPATINQKMTVPVDLRTQANLTPKGQIMASGETNLPDQTELIVSVSNEETGINATHKSLVRNGKFSAGPIGPESGLLPGDYVISTLMPVPMTGQPESVQLIIGEKGEFLTGPLVKKSSLGTGNYAEYSFQHVIGSKQTITNLQKENRKKVVEVRSSLDRLLKNGRAMEQFRNSNDLSAIAKCREMMIENGNQAELIQAKAEELRTKTIHKEFIALGAASIEMRLCVTCSDNALESCDSAADYLQNGL